MDNHKIFHLDLGKQRNQYARYVYDLGFTGKKDFVYFFYLNQIKKEDRTEQQIRSMKNYVEEASQVSDLYRNISLLPNDILPATLYTMHGEKKDVILPDFFKVGGGYLIMSEAFANVLKSCRLGKTQIIPIRFFDLFHNEYVNETTYYLLNVAEKYQYFLPELTEPKPFFQYKKNGIDVYFSAIKQEMHDNYIYSSRALSCPVDLWGDPALSGDLYISEPLMEALKQAGFTKIVNLWECQLA